MIEHINYEYSENTELFAGSIDSVRLEYHCNYRRLVNEQFCLINGVDDFENVAVSFLRKFESNGAGSDFQIRTYLVRWNERVFISRVHISYDIERVTMHCWEI